MKTQKSILYAVVALTTLIISCSNNQPPHLSPTEISMVIGDPVEFGAKDYLLFPVGANYNPEIVKNENAESISDVASNRSDKKISSEQNVQFLTRNDVQNNMSSMKDASAQYEFINANEADFDIRNLLFYNKKTGETYPLVKDTVHILSFAFHYEYPKPLIFYRIVKKDINKDKKYNSKDAVMLYMSDTMGRNFVAITAPNEQLLTYFYYQESNTLLVKTSIDIDNDGKFTATDETNFREVKLDNPSLGREIFPKELKDSLKTYMY